MKRPLFRIVAMTLTLVMLVTSLYVSPMSVSAETTTATSAAPTLAYVPLDDRPVVCDRVQYAATAAGFNIVFPPDKSWYQTHLDDQLVNADDTATKYTNEAQVGNGYRIMGWLEDMEAAGCNYYIIHLDQMFSGGLVGSRYPEISTDDSGRINISEQLKIAEKLAVLAEKSENHVYFIDTVMRLASTGYFKGYDGGADYDAFRAYAQVERVDTLDENNWKTTSYETAENLLKITDNSSTLFYFARRNKNWGVITAADVTEFSKTDLTDTDIHNYLLSRNRKLRLINYMIQYAPSACYIVGVDDSSPNNTIQSNEIKFIEARMEAMGIDYKLFADTDSLGLMATARCAKDYYYPKVIDEETGEIINDNNLKAYVHYYGDRAGDPADQYDTGSLLTNTNAHLACAGVSIVDNASDANFEVLILTRINTSSDDRDPTYDIHARETGTLVIDGDDVTQYNQCIDDLCDRANENINNNIPTIVMDASSIFTKVYVKPNVVSGYTLKNLQDELLERVEIGKLLGYSNWNTVGNTLGIGIGQGVSRYAYLASDASKTTEASIAAVQSITYSYVKDIAYNARHKNGDYDWMFYKWIAGKASSGVISKDMNFYSQLKGYNYTEGPQAWETFSGERYFNLRLGEKMRDGDSNSSTLADSYVTIVNCLLNDEFYTDLSNKETPRVCSAANIELSNFRMPWYRKFEITFNIDVELEDTYVYSDDGYIEVPVGTEVKRFTEDVRADKTASDDRELFEIAENGTEKTYSDYNGASYTLTSPGPYIYTTDTIAQVTVTKADDNTTALVGTGYKVTVKGTTYETVVQADVAGAVEGEGDGEINTRDAREALRYVVGMVDLTEAQKEAADMDNGGANAIGSNDARRILQEALKS